MIEDPLVWQLTDSTLIQSEIVNLLANSVTNLWEKSVWNQAINNSKKQKREFSLKKVSPSSIWKMKFPPPPNKNCEQFHTKFISNGHIMSDLMHPNYEVISFLLCKALLHYHFKTKLCLVYWSSSCFIKATSPVRWCFMFSNSRVKLRG